ncbi:hypothetical protein RchiOBHm_Chr4g0431841 [Rosa chinensis]|uniref:Uncharacterized protein n=1 Tax=Rosa chinensis TaxID=74649 RepID=A0A2P6R0W7_ROSCH|nr:hypothetical protein RchiOBHm_Chr4g0431841 [Rosa chinensis]
MMNRIRKSRCINQIHYAAYILLVCLRNCCLTYVEITNLHLLLFF